MFVKAVRLVVLVRILLFFFVIVWILFVGWCGVVPWSKIGADKQNISESATRDFDETLTVSKKITMSDLLWKPSVFVWCETSDPLCIQFIPSFESRIFDVYKDEIHMYVVTDSESYFFSAIPQLSPLWLPLWLIDNELWSCNIIPRRIVLNSAWELLLASCGWEKSLADLEKKLMVTRSETTN